MQHIYEHDGNKSLRYTVVFRPIDNSTFYNSNTFPSTPVHDVDNSPGNFSPMR